MDTSQCPLCGNANRCGAAAGAATCWCYNATIPTDVITRIPAAARGRVCVCQACAEAEVKSESEGPKREWRTAR